MISLLIIILVASGQCAKYSDEFARMLLPLSSAAYVDNPWMCVGLHFPNSEIRRQVNVDCDRGHICSGFTAVLHNHKAIAVAFRGTTNPLQLLDEAIKSVISSWVDWPYGGMVSKYFYDGFMRIWEAGMEADVKVLRAQYPTYEIWVTGHSLGGAMASLAAHAIVGSRIADGSMLKLVTLGQPRTGDKVFAKNHTASIDYSFRITHWRDVVPHIPSFDERPAGYYHHKTEGRLQEIFSVEVTKSSAEVFYKEGMSPKDYVVCEEYEDFKCSDGLWVHTSVKNHKRYFGKIIRDWGKAGCL